MFNVSVHAKQAEIPTLEDDTLGKYAHYFQEHNGNISLKNAIDAFNNGQSKPSTNDSISLGIGVDPVWLKLTINNTHAQAQLYRLSVATPWLDRIDTWLMHNHEQIRHIVGGDGLGFEQRPMPYRFYAFEHDFQPGITEIYMRVESLGPMAIPIRLSKKQAAISRDISTGYQYGLLYGIMVALALYNLVLFIFIRQKEYGLYSLYLVGFVLNSLSYTGQIHAVITPDFGPYFQDWVDIFLIISIQCGRFAFCSSIVRYPVIRPCIG
ncbi:7TMR-DISM family protein [Pseudoalteromonas sp. GB56]